MAAGKRRAATVVKSMVDGGKVEELVRFGGRREELNGYGC